MKRILFYMTVTGEDYQAYIPPFLYCLKRAYPEAGALIACQESLDPAVASRIARLPNRDEIYIKAGVFQDFPKGLRRVAMCLRWLTYHPEFADYEYVYIGDIDILIAQEPWALLDRHIACMGSACYSNRDDIDPDFPPEAKVMTGLHLVKVGPYYEKMAPLMQKYYEETKLNNDVPSAWQTNYGHANQKGLRLMLKEAGIYSPATGLFRYHGLHLGNSRNQGWWDLIFDPTSGREEAAYAMDLVPLLRTPEFLSFVLSSSARTEIDIMCSAWENRRSA